ncbi:MAG: efflux RND transporter periplasmic adaptor subunit [candidate division NC10 bacterium]|nr:efflux RND transporter periplasmic adaptor subunit [candidate division NC10 bacterium]
MGNANPEPDIVRTVASARSAKRRQRLTRVLAVLLLGIAAKYGVTAWQAAHAPQAPQYKSQEAGRGDLAVTVTATGTLQPTKQVDVGSEVSGTVRSVEVSYNAGVKVGQILARIDTTKLDAQTLQYKAALDSARAKLLQTQATVAEARASLGRLQRARELSNNKLPSQADMDSAVATLARADADEASAAAGVAQAKATLDASETDLGKSVIRSPINGVVLTRSVEPGQTVAASLSTPTLFTLAEDLAQMELHVYVDEADVGRVKEGQPATFTVDAYPGRAFQAWIAQVRYNSKTVSGVVTYETVLSLENADLSLRPGMTATAVITVKKVENRVLVPNGALRFAPLAQQEQTPASSGGLLRRLLPGPPPAPPKAHADTSGDAKRPRVWTVRSGELVAIPVTVGSTDGIMTEIVGGDVEPGMVLVVDTISGNQ